jgi:hypothetical protein
MVKCYICKNEIKPENKSSEHILLNCIGGKLKSNNLVCIKCNSEFGSEIDRHLCGEMDVISNLLNIKRERGKPRTIIAKDSNGVEYFLKPGGKYLRKVPVELIPKGYEITANSTEQFIGILKGIKKKFPNIDCQEILKNVKDENYFIDQLNINFSFDDDHKTLRAICKIAVNYYIFNNGSIRCIEHLIPYLEGTDEKESIWVYYPEKDEFYYPEKNNEVLHSIILNGNKEEKILWAYVELFSTFGFIVLLNDDYTGENLDKTYFFNVLSGKEVSKNLKDIKSRKELIKTSEEYSIKNLTEKLNNLMPNIRRIHISNAAKDRAFGIFSKWINNYSAGTEITEPMIKALLIELSQELDETVSHMRKNFNIKEIALFAEIFSKSIQICTSFLSGKNDKH